ncbi:hypothetical protein AcetOrient_orf01966 [Acetobacter orientalis]|uniref:Uncharacterized protein n=1 Tax=Acetobacter orientalis TaxID=146474 RepID=A0A2Z5ZGG1_9PROT|nr:hypothetical protein AcetOrient_orf01966 [Acetobacter orientalis]
MLLLWCNSHFCHHNTEHYGTLVKPASKVTCSGTKTPAVSTFKPRFF